MKRKYDKVVLTFVLDGRNRAINQTNEDGLALMDAIQKAYLTIDDYRYAPEKIELFVRDGTNQKVVMIKEGRR